MNKDGSLRGIDAINKAREDKQRQEALLKAEEEEYRLAVNRIFSTPDGKYFLNKLKRACGLNSFDSGINPAKLVEDAGRRKIWLELIRPYVNQEILRELEQ